MMTKMQKLGQGLRRTASGAVLAFLLAAVPLSLAGGTAQATLDMDHGSPNIAEVTADATDAMAMPNVPMLADREAVRIAASVFVWGLSNREPDAVWHFAPDQARAQFGKSVVALSFFARVHPPLANAKSITFDGIVERDGVQIAQIYIKDRLGVQWLASLGFALNPESQLRIVSCHLVAAPGDLT